RVRVREETRGRGRRQDQVWKRLGLEPGREQVGRDDPVGFLRLAEALRGELPHHGVVLDPELRRNAVVEDLADLGVVEVVLRAGGVDEMMDLLRNWRVFSNCMRSIPSPRRIVPEW